MYKSIAALAALSFVQVQGVTLDVSSTDSIKSASSTLATGMVKYYTSNSTGIPGLLPDPYYWWEGGAMFSTLLQYWQLTGDKQYNDIVSRALVFQQGSDSDFMPANQTKSEGNDDQATWALAAMSAAELKFSEPTGTKWISLADAVFNEQVARWDTATCNGGLRWQIFTFNAGYKYKNSISNGDLFQLASRLARFTGNTTYSDWATKVYDWSTEVGFIDSKSNVFDGADASTNCSAISKLQFSYVAGTYISGVAYMYNITSGNSQWKNTLDSLLNQTLSVFFPSGIATEVACESKNNCAIDMFAFKGILAQQLVNTIQMAPYTSDLILPKITTSAQAAATACKSGACPSVWSAGSTKNDMGLGQQLSALSYVQALLVHQGAGAGVATGASNGTVTTPVGGSSTGTNPSATKPPVATETKSSAGVNGVSMVGTMALMGAASWLVL